MWSVLAHIYPVDSNPEWVTKYKTYENELNFNGISFPVDIKSIARFENKTKSWYIF